MMTIVTHVHLKEGAARDWEAAMRTRLSAAKKRPGWVGGQLLRPIFDEGRRSRLTWAQIASRAGVRSKTPHQPVTVSRVVGVRRRAGSPDAA